MALLNTGNGHLPSEEWLDKAKAVPLGQSRRVRHGFEPDAAMTVYNEAGKWSAYCWRCHAGGWVRKDLVQLVAAPVAAPSRDPGQMQVIQPGSALYSQIIVLLQQKNVSLPVISFGRPLYSPRDQRLVLTTDDGQIGRAMRPGQFPKWNSYRDRGYMRGGPGDFSGADVVVTEDYFSALKIGHYVPDVLPVASLGTRLRPALLARLLDAKSVTVLYDGDAAGEHGWAPARRKLALVGVPCRRLSPPPGLDPKDLRPDQLVEILNAGC